MIKLALAPALPPGKDIPRLLFYEQLDHMDKASWLGLEAAIVAHDRCTLQQHCPSIPPRQTHPAKDPPLTHMSWTPELNGLARSLFGSAGMQHGRTLLASDVRAELIASGIRQRDGHGSQVWEEGRSQRVSQYRCWSQVQGGCIQIAWSAAAASRATAAHHHSALCSPGRGG